MVAAVMCSNSPAWMRVRTPLAHGSSSSSTSSAPTVVEAIEGCADQLQEQAFFVANIRDVGLRMPVSCAIASIDAP